MCRMAKEKVPVGSHFVRKWLPNYFFNYFDSQLSVVGLQGI